MADQSSYRIDGTDDSEARERRRLDALGRIRDPRTFEVLAGIGITDGWSCLEVGAGSGSVSEWMAGQVGPRGAVLSVDVDLRFHRPMPANVDVRVLDVVHEELAVDTFDLVHARAVLQHIPEREEVLRRLVATVKPGGWIVVEDGDFQAFETQSLPEPLGAVHRAMIEASTARIGWERNFGTRLPELLRENGLVDIDATGDSWPMRGGHDSGEWWFLALEHVRDVLPLVTDVTLEQIDAALVQAREPGFVMLGPLSLAVWGRRPGGTA